MANKDYQRHVHRLREEQQKALRETDDNIKQWEKFKSDYGALKGRLKTLPDKLSHDVMVPLGKMGFMPGQLVHTNEILVLLGDNWFVDRSAKQAAEIVTRRTAAIDKQLEEFHKQRKLLEPRHDFTKDLQTMAEGGGDTFDIREEYDEEKERVWKEKHKKNVAEHRKKMKKGKGKQETSVKGPTEEQLWERLDELERLELKGREMEKIDSDAEAGGQQADWLFSGGQTQQSDNQTVFPQGQTGNTSQTYTSSDDESDTSSRSLDSDDFEEAENKRALTDSDEEVTSKGKVIHFSHSTQQDSSKVTATSGAVSEVSVITNPAEIYTKFKPPEGPTSILKKTKSGVQKGVRERREKKRVVEFETGSEEEENKTKTVQDVRSQVHVEKAFTGTVLEKVPSVLPSPQTVQTEPHRPVSKFKMRSANQSPETEIVQDSRMDKSKDINESENVKPVSKFKAQRQKLNPR